MSYKNSDLEGEVFFLDIVNFLQSAWKKLVIASIFGAALGLTGWFFLGNYSAEYILQNNNQAIDFLSWRGLQKTLPLLAAQIRDENKVSENEASFYRLMSDEHWWQKSIVINYGLTKFEIRDLPGIAKNFDGASSLMLSFSFFANGSSKEQATNNVLLATKFMRTGGAYLQLRTLLNDYEAKVITTTAELQQKSAITHIEIGYQQERIRQLESLYKRFPGNGSISQQVVDAKDSSAKYLPIQTQIIAVNNEINVSKESLSRYQNHLQQTILMKDFLDLARPIKNQSFDGLVLINQLLEVESSMRVKLDKGDVNRAAALDELRKQLITIQIRFTKGLEASTPPSSSPKKGMLKSIVGGLFAVFFLMLLVLLGQIVWQKIKSGNAKRS